MAIYKRKGGKIWYIRLKPKNRKRIQISTGTQDKQAALRLHNKIENDIWRQDKIGERLRYTWKEVIVEWVKEQNPDRSSLRNNKLTLNWLSKYLEDKFLDEIDRNWLEHIAKEKESAGVAGSTVNKTLELIQSILNRAYAWGWIESVPPIRKRKIPPPRDRWIKSEEAAKLLSELPEHQKDIMILALCVGLRHSNVVKMEWRVIDLDRRHAYVESCNAKSRKSIAVPLNDMAIEILTRRAQAANKHPKYVFTYLGKPIQRVNGNAWRSALKRAGITDFRWHDLRHTWASWHVQNGTQLGDLMRMGAWAKLDMVMRYAHQSSDNLQEAAARISGVKLVQLEK